MPDSSETLAFVTDSFRSVWALELLLILKSDRTRAWPQSELVNRLRASDSVVGQSLDSLLAGGLVVLEEDGVRYAPASPDIGRLSDAAEQLYAKRPSTVRRLIVSSPSDSLAAFADAFRLRGD